MKKTVPLLSLLTLLILTGCYGTGDAIKEEAYLNAKDVNEVVVSVSSANVEIVSEDRDDIYVVFNTYEKSERLMTKEGTVTYIETKTPKLLGVPVGVVRKDLTVYLPEEYDKDLDLKLSSGSLKMEEFKLDDVTCDLSSGGIDFSGMEFGALELDLSSGDVDMDYVVVGEMNADLSSGKLELKHFTGALEGKLSSGSVEISYLNDMNDLDIDVSSGDVTVTYNEGVDGHFRLSTSSGRIRTDLNFDYQEIMDDGDEFEGGIGDETYEIRIKTSSGDITVGD